MLAERSQRAQWYVHTHGMGCGRETKRLAKVIVYLLEVVQQLGGLPVQREHVLALHVFHGLVQLCHLGEQERGAKIARFGAGQQQ